MFKNVFGVAVALWAGAVFAAPEINKATAAELDAIKGVGPSMSATILEQRGKGEFKDWNDLMSRVKGLREKKAAKLSAEGLTVNGASFNSSMTPEKAPRHSKSDKAGKGETASKATDKIADKAMAPAAAKP